MENISIIFKIFRGRYFCLFPEKGVDSPNKIPAETVFRTANKNKLLRKVYFLQEIEKRATESSRFLWVSLHYDFNKF